MSPPKFTYSGHIYIAVRNFCFAHISDSMHWIFTILAATPHNAPELGLTFFTLHKLKHLCTYFVFVFINPVVFQDSLKLLSTHHDYSARYYYEIYDHIQVHTLLKCTYKPFILITTLICHHKTAMFCNLQTQLNSL